MSKCIHSAGASNSKTISNWMPENYKLRIRKKKHAENATGNNMQRQIKYPEA